jgi:cell division protein FtsN
MQHMNKQRGGTLLGFILGIVIGLGVALGVAVYVTKVPVPFVNKASSRTVEQDVMETQRNKDWDPNAALQTKPAAKPVDPAVAPVAAPVLVPEPVPATAAVKPSAAPSVEIRPAVSADPLGDLAKARSGAAKSDGYSYFVQIGAFRTAADAESQRARLSLGGTEAKVSEREQSGSTVYRVRVGPFDKKDDAIQSKEKLAASGLDTALVSVAR